MLTKWDTTEGNNIVYIKWFYSEILFDETLDIYREDNNNGVWNKINSHPVFKGAIVPSTLQFKNDPQLNNFIDAIQSLADKKPEGVFKLLLLSKAILSDAFANYIGIQFIDTTITINSTYRYKLVTSKSNTTIALSTKTNKDSLTKNNIAQNPHCKAANKKVMIRWTPNEKKIFAVNIYRSNDSTKAFIRCNKTPVLVNKVKNSKGEMNYPEYFFTDDSLENNTTYYYKLKAIDYFGKESRFSDMIQASPDDPTLPPAPFNVTASQKSGKVYMSWAIDSNKTLESLDIINYHERDSTRKYKASLHSNKRNFIDSTAEVGLNYYYIEAKYTRNKKSKSPVIAVIIPDTKAPSKPHLIKITADSGIIHLMWNKAKESDLEGYRLYRGSFNKDTSKLTLVNADPIKDTLFSDYLPKQARNRFYYRIAAIDTSWNISELSDAATIRMPDVIAPPTPSIINIISIDSSINIQWIQPPVDDLASYNIYHKMSNDSHDAKIFLTIANKEKTNNYTIPCIPGSNIYYIQAIDSANNKSSLSEGFTINISERKTNKTIEGIIIKQSNKKICIEWKKPEIKDCNFQILISNDNKPFHVLAASIKQNSASIAAKEIRLPVEIKILCIGKMNEKAIGLIEIK